MKKFFTLLILILSTSFAANLFANTVYVSGHVKYANGSPVVNQAVTVINDSSSQGNTCGVMIRVKFTNANGFYSDTLSCTGTINVVRTTTTNCNGLMLTNQNSVNPNTQSVESNFQLSCNQNNIICAANFNNNVNGLAVQFTNLSVSPNSTINSYFWSFGNGQTSTLANPTTTYSNAGTYNVCLRIASTNGCMDSVCKAVVISPTNTGTCNAEFQMYNDTSDYRRILLFAGINTSSATINPVVERRWRFGNGDSLLGNVQNPIYQYAQPGTYTVCLRVRTQNGCVSDFCRTVVITNPALNACFPRFTFIPQGTSVTFNSSTSTGFQGDAIVSRRWTFGDNSAALTGNIVSPQYQYAQPGVYTVCLTIKTVNGCEKSICVVVAVGTSPNTACVPQFTIQRVAAKKVMLNSSVSWVAANDSIIERKWRFGDGSFLNTGNAVTVTHEYPTNGVYTACLFIKTARGCVNEICKPIVLQDSIVLPPSGINEPIRIISLFPNPATINLNSMIWSANNNVASQIAIFDIYGQRKWSRNVNLVQGSNVVSVPVASLPTGPYFFKVFTVYGVKSRQFFKL